MNYYIEGDAAKAEQIKAAFEKLGYNTGYLGFTSDQLYYTVEGKVELMRTKSLQNLIKTHPDYKELELPKPHYDIVNFHAGMPVLVRPDNDCAWDYSVFSRITDNEYWKFSVCNGVSFTQCIPFNEKTKHLLGTTDIPSEEFINW